MNSSKYLSQKILLKTVTPIYIGQNQANDLSPYSDFVQLGNEIIYIDEKKFEEALFAKEALIDKYVKSVRQKIDKSRTQSDFNLINFITENLGDVNSFIKYKIPTDQDLKHQTIKRFINTSSRPFIPGSSIKGNFRTAVIYDWLSGTNTGKNLVKELFEKIQNLSERILELEIKKNDNSISEDETRELKKIKWKKNSESEIGRIYDEQKLFGRMSKDNLYGFDSRHLQISDSNSFTIENLSILKLHRIKLRDTSEVSPLPSETLNSNIEGSFTLKLEKDFVQNDLKKFNSFEIKDIFKILNEFSLASINYELDTFNEFHDKISSTTNREKNNYSAVINFYESLKSKIKSSNNEFAIVRLGGGKTFFDNSIGLALYNYDKNLFKKYRELMELGKNRDGKLVQGKFPTTRTLVETTKLPIGWIAISTDKNLIQSLNLYQSKVIPVEQTNSQPIIKSQSSPQQKSYILAEIIDATSKPPMVKILEGDYKDKETMLPAVKLETFNLTKGSKVYVELSLQKKILQKADYKGRLE